MWPVPLPVADVPVLLGERKGRKWKPKNQSKNFKRLSCQKNYSYGIAAESTASSPCSNILIHCPICSMTDLAIWKYFMKVHFQEKHKTLDLTKYKHLWELSHFERIEMKKIWVKRGKVTTRHTKKSKLYRWSYQRTIKHEFL